MDTEAGRKIDCHCGQSLIVPKNEPLTGVPVDYYDDDYEDDEPEQVTVNFGGMGAGSCMLWTGLGLGLVWVLIMTFTCCGGLLSKWGLG